jgi:hypothetical protein
MEVISGDFGVMDQVLVIVCRIVEESDNTIRQHHQLFIDLKRSL